MPKTKVKSTNASRKIKKKLPTTAKMVDAALIELHSVSGMSLKKLSSFIMDKYKIEATYQRNYQIKKRLRELQQSNDIFNKSGGGLRGRFKLANKHQFMNNNKSSKQYQNFVKGSKTEMANILHTHKSPIKRSEEHTSSFLPPTSPDSCVKYTGKSPRSSLPKRERLSYVGMGRRLTFDD